MRFRAIGAAGFALVVLGLPAAAGAQINPADFDFNKNGQIDPGPEAEAFLKHVNKQLGGVFRAIDANKDGKIDNAERDAFEAKAQDAIAEDLVDFQDVLGKRSGIPVADVEDRWGLAKEPEPLSLFGFQVRRKYDDVSASEAGNSRRFRDATPALFSFARDFQTDNSVWEAHVSLLYPLRMTGKAGDPDALSVILVPSVSLDKISSENKKGEVDSLTFRLGSEAETRGFLPAMELQYFRLNLAYATDTRFDSAVGAVEFEWEPVILRAGLHSRRRVADLFEYRARTILAAQAGRTFDAGRKENLEEDAHFVRVGPKLELTVWPRVIERLSAGVAFQYLAGLVGKPDHAYLLDAFLNFQLDARGHFSLQVAYQKGRVPLTEEDSNAFSVGIGVKF